MLKKLVLFLCLSLPVCAQEVFWGFDDNGKEMFIPAECDSTFDADELYDLGMRFLNETGYIQQGSGYCMIASAFLGNVDAQYRVAWMYHRGIGLPKSDLAAYKWASLAALKGHQEADELAVNIEQFLSVEDMEQSTAFLNETIKLFNQMSEKEAMNDDLKIQELEKQISTLRREILELTLFKEIKSAEEGSGIVEAEKDSDQKPSDNSATVSKKGTNGKRTGRAKKTEPIFNQSDLENAPMP